MKRTELKRKTPLKRSGWTLSRVEMISGAVPPAKTIKAVRPRRRKPGIEKRAPEVYTMLLARCEGRCELGISRECSGRFEHPHHRLMVSHQGPDELWNLLAVCAACHRAVHSEPSVSYERGWLLRATTQEKEGE